MERYLTKNAQSVGTVNGMGGRVNHAVANSIMRIDVGRETVLSLPGISEFHKRTAVGKPIVVSLFNHRNVGHKQHARSTGLFRGFYSNIAGNACSRLRSKRLIPAYRLYCKTPWGNVAARPFLPTEAGGLPQDWEQDIIDIIQQHIAAAI
jgi:hypothetical protein